MKKHLTRTRSILLAGLSMVVCGFIASSQIVPSSQAATGEVWKTGVEWAGVATKNNAEICSVTVVSNYLALTAKHCPEFSSVKLNVPRSQTAGNNYKVLSTHPHPSLDVKALWLGSPTYTEMKISALDTNRPFYSWGYGKNTNEVWTFRLTRSKFSSTGNCEEWWVDRPSSSDMCWGTSMTQSVCHGDSGGPVTQDGFLIGLVTAGRTRESGKCTAPIYARAIALDPIRDWVNHMIEDAELNPDL